MGPLRMSRLGMRASSLDRNDRLAIVLCSSTPSIVQHGGGDRRRTFDAGAGPASYRRVHLLDGSSAPPADTPLRSGTRKNEVSSTSQRGGESLSSKEAIGRVQNDPDRS